MEVKENTVFTKEYYERDKRHIGNALHIFFSDGSPKLELRIDFPDRPPQAARRRHAGAGAEVRGLRGRALSRRSRREAIKALFARQDFDSMPVNEFMARSWRTDRWTHIRTRRADLEASASMTARKNWASSSTSRSSTLLWRYAQHAARAQRARESHVHRVARRHPHAAHARQPVGRAAPRRRADASSTSARAVVFRASRSPWPVPEREFTLIDGTQKKIRFVAESIAALDIRNAQRHRGARRELPGEKNFDVVVVRAVGTLADVVHNAGAAAGAAAGGCSR